MLSTIIKQPFVTKTFVLSDFAWQLKTGFTVPQYNIMLNKFWDISKRRI